MNGAGGILFIFIIVGKTLLALVLAVSNTGGLVNFYSYFMFLNI